MAFLADVQSGERVAERHEVGADATLRATESAPVDVLVVNMSVRGCLFICAEPLDVGATFTIGIAGIGRRTARIIRVEEDRYGGEFIPALTNIDLQLVIAAPQQTVATFPSEQTADAVVLEDRPPIVPKLPRGARLFIASGLIAATWAGIFAARAWLV